MKIHFRCPDCSEKLKAIHELGGEDIECPVCGATIEVPFLYLESGVEIGGYLIQDELGEGGMGAVYLALQLSINRPVALKVLSSALASDETMVKRFLREARNMASLEHSNIVKVIDAGQDEDQFYIAMEYVEGCTLQTVIDESNGPLDHEDSLCCIFALVEALQIAWDRRKLIHRDIKPENIIFNLDGVPKLLDLGLSKSLLNTGEELTLQGDVLGTPNYMSPEQAAGEKTLDFRTDIYALGSTLYHMVTAVLPFESGDSNPYLLLEARLEGTLHLEDPRVLNPELPRGVARILCGMLGHTPADRYASYAHLRHDIECVLEGKQPETAPTGTTVIRGVV